MNWGTRIIIIMSLFVCMIGYFVVRSMQQGVDLVAPDYYAREIRYQGTIDKMNNAKALSSGIVVHKAGEAITVAFPGEMKGKVVTGTINLFKPSDKTQDRVLAITLNQDAAQQIDAAALTGMYKVQVDWTADGKDYYSEQSVVF
jgi:hypothetical protein